MADVLTPYYKRLPSHCYTVYTCVCVCSYKVGIGRRTGLLVLTFSEAITCPDAAKLSFAKRASSEMMLANLQITFTIHKLNDCNNQLSLIVLQFRKNISNDVREVSEKKNSN